MEMRKLSGQDTFIMVKILSRAGVKDAIKEFLKRKDKLSKKEVSQDKVFEIGLDIGVDVMDIIINNLDKVQEDINKLLASLCNVTIEDIKKLDFMEYNSLILEFFKKEELKSFFMSISSFIK